ncbi:MAG: prefoldin subunit alpha [Thermoplasmata archaeon]|nr:prefoldin subunit alpha [Thermoplasmata archaeon]
MSEMDKEIAQIRLLEREAQAYNAQMEMLLQSLANHRLAIETVEAIPRLETGDVFLVPIGGGVILRTKWGPEDGLLVDIGAGVVIERGAPEIGNFLGDRVHELEAAATRAEQHLRELRAQLAALSQRVQEKYEGSADVQDPA